MSGDVGERGVGHVEGGGGTIGIEVLRDKGKSHDIVNQWMRLTNPRGVVTLRRSREVILDEAVGFAPHCVSSYLQGSDPLYLNGELVMGKGTSNFIGIFLGITIPLL